MEKRRFTHGSALQTIGDKKENLVGNTIESHKEKKRKDIIKMLDHKYMSSANTTF